MTDDRLAELTDRLEQTAARLKAGHLAPDDAARLVEDCARLASDAAAELDRRARGASAEPPATPDQPELSSPDQPQLL